MLCITAAEEFFYVDKFLTMVRKEKRGRYHVRTDKEKGLRGHTGTRQTMGQQSLPWKQRNTGQKTGGKDVDNCHSRLPVFIRLF